MCIFVAYISFLQSHFRIWLKYVINMDCITHKVLHQIYGLFFFFHH